MYRLTSQNSSNPAIYSIVMSLSSTSVSKGAILPQPADETINRIPDACAQNRVQIAACLLGVSQDISDVSADEISQQQEAQACYDAMASVEPDFAPQGGSAMFEDEIGDKTCWSIYFFMPLFTDPGISSISNPDEHNKG